MKLGELDSKISERLARERNALEQTAQNELQRLQTALNASVSAALATTASVIEERSQTLSTSLTKNIDGIEDRCALLLSLVLRNGILLFLMSLLATLGSFAGCWFMTSGTQADLRSMRTELAGLTAERDNLLHTLSQLEKKTWGIVLHEDKNGRFIVLPTKTKVLPNWTMGKQQAIKLE